MGQKIEAGSQINEKHGGQGMTTSAVFISYGCHNEVLQAKWLTQFQRLEV